MNSEEENKLKKHVIEEKSSHNKTQVNNVSLVKVDIDIQEFKYIIEDIIKNSSFISLKDHIQHMKTSRYEHCYNVAYYTYVISKKLGLDYVSATRGALLHDFYFYDWRNKGVDGQKHFHAYRHPGIALKNASENFDLNNLEKDIIVKHMWPLTLKLPRFSESYVVTLVDKYCAIKEFFDFFKYKRELKKLAKINKLNNQEEK